MALPIKDIRKSWIQYILVWGMFVNSITIYYVTEKSGEFKDSWKKKEKMSLLPSWMEDFSPELPLIVVFLVVLRGTNIASSCSSHQEKGHKIHQPEKETIRCFSLFSFQNFNQSFNICTFWLKYFAIQKNE